LFVVDAFFRQPSRIRPQGPQFALKERVHRKIGFGNRAAIALPFDPSLRFLARLEEVERDPTAFFGDDREAVEGFGFSR
jgi:hypothetical protein